MPAPSRAPRATFADAALASPPGVPVDLNHALSGLDQARTSLVIHAVRHANGTLPVNYPNR